MTAAWWSGSLVPFDLETDGVDPTDARIISACVAVCSPGMGADVRTWLAKPERPIPQGAIDVHGITTERAEYEGVDRAIVIEQIARSLAGEPGDAVPVVGHNLSYDCTVLDRELRRLGVGSLGVADGGGVSVRIDGRQVGSFLIVDTMVLDKAVDTYRPGKRQLSYVAEHYGVPIRGDAHTADADALAAGRTAWAIAKRCSEPSATLFERYRDRKKPEQIVRSFYTLGTLTLPQLHAYQRREYVTQAEGLREYFIKSGTGDPDSVSTAWPIQPVGVTTADVL